MKRSDYKEILGVIRSHPWDFDSCLDVLRKKFPEVSVETLRSILSHQHKERVKSTIYYQKNKKSQTYDKFLDRRANPKSQNQHNVIVGMAKDVAFSPALMAKLLLEEDLQRTKGAKPTSNQINPLFKDTNLITDGRLAAEVMFASLKDNVYGHVSDWIKHSYGQAYERKLKCHLQKLNLPFLDEHQLRLRGYDKTPDVKLEVPISVDGFIINWIESKALFGDDDSHNGYLESQLYSYWNRFGPGLVIYWFGFIDDLDNVRERGIMVADSFPTELSITKLEMEHSVQNLQIV